jgi:circadian clock protein KaiB
MSTALSDDTMPAWELRLIVAGGNDRSLRAIECVRGICHHQLRGNVNLEVIDMYQQTGLAAQYRVVTAPSLVRLFPLPVRHIIGDLSDAGHVLLQLLPALEQDSGHDDA